MKDVIVKCFDRKMNPVAEPDRWKVYRLSLLVSKSTAETRYWHAYEIGNVDDLLME